MMRIPAWKVSAHAIAGSRCGWESVFFFSSRRRHTRFDCDWSSDVCSSDLQPALAGLPERVARHADPLRIARADQPHIRPAVTDVDQPAGVDAGEAGEGLVAEIGRASGRERG